MLKKGDKGEQVKKLQKWLNGYGFNSGPIDGIFGPVTENAVILFQTAAGVVIDGIVGPQTRDAMSQMEKLLAKVDLQIKEDSNTALLDHLNKDTKGKAYGSINYENSLLTLNQAVNLSKGTYIKYSFNGWYSNNGQGTVEMWINPRSYPARLINFNWGDVGSYPAAGHVLHLNVKKDKKLGYGGWGGNFDVGLDGNRVIPLNQWTHVAVTWGPDGTKLYVNGLLDAYTTVNRWPALRGTTYAYLNYWGETDLGLIDELHISKVARTGKEIFCHVYSLLNVPGCRG